MTTPVPSMEPLRLARYRSDTKIAAAAYSH